nr:ribonuclease H-like domain-containing protein [Tanacetum cinerariifolium]
MSSGDTPEQKVTPPPQITTVTSLSAKFPYLKKGEYDIWAMKMQNYISSTDLQCWNIVQKGNSQKNITSDTKVPASALANAAFVSSSSSSSSQSKLSYQETNGGGSSAKHSASKGSSSTKSSAIDDVIYSLIADYEEDQHLAFEDLDQVNKEAFDEYEIKHQMEMIAIKAPEPTILADRVIAAEASVLAVDGIPADLEFA